MKCVKCKKIKANCYIRTFLVCKKCFNVYKEDNKRRINRDITIPKKLILIQNEKNKRGRRYGSSNKVKKRN